MLRTVTAIFIILLGGTFAMAEMKPQVIDTTFPTSDVVIASIVLQPTQGDASVMIQNAIDEAATAGGGVIFIPAGRYRLEQSLLMKEGVTLRGDWTPPTKGGVQGTILMPMHGKGSTEGAPAFVIERGSGLRDVSIWYPDQDAQNISEYPWCIRGVEEGNIGDNTTVHNVTLVNPYLGIKIGPEWNELHTLRNIYGTPLKTGIWNDFCTDIGRLIEIDFAPRWWAESGLENAPKSVEARAALNSYLLENATGVEIGRSDWEYLYNVRITGYNQGFRFFVGEKGTTNAVMFGCEATGCDVGLRTDALNGVGLAATGCKFAGRTAGVYTPETFDTVLQLNTCILSGHNGPALLQDGKGTVTVQNCTFADWSARAAEINSGYSSIMGSRFARTGNHVRIGEDVQRARILGNKFDGKPQIDNLSKNDIMIGNGNLTFDRPDVSPYDAPPDPSPATRELFVVTDFGAATTADDNTIAFQTALDAAGAAGGGTVYVPAGLWKLSGSLNVPTGVELRGVFDVPHHTISAGSVLLPTSGKGEEDGTPFISLQEKSGVRGMTFWWPEQHVGQPIAYPWAIQGQGPKCWVLDIAMGNAYQGVDFGTNNSTGHLVRYLSGTFLRRGVYVSKSAGGGRIEDIQFNPHYSQRIPDSYPRPYTEDPWNATLDYMWKNLDGIIVGSCDDEQLKGTFLFDAYRGLWFKDDNGGANARVINHGTDAGSVGILMDATGAKGVDFINAQIVHFGPVERCALETGPGYTGKTRFFNTQMWAGPLSGIIDGKGDLLVQQLNTTTGPFKFLGGRSELINANFTQNLKPHILVEPGIERVRLTANVCPAGTLNVENNAGDKLRRLANSASLRPQASQIAQNYEFATGWEDNEPAGSLDTIANPGGGLLEVSNYSLTVTQEDVNSGSNALKFSGEILNKEHAFCYMRVFEEPIGIASDSMITYSMKPLNENGRHVGIDLYFTDGTIMRDTGLTDLKGNGVHPLHGRGTVGEWTKIQIPIGGRCFGKVIAAVMIAFDGRETTGTFETLIDDLSFTSDLGKTPWEVSVNPAGGFVLSPLTVNLNSGAAILYTLDGSNPDEDATLYTGPITLEGSGLQEIRYITQADNGRLSPIILSELFDLTPR